MKRYRAVFLSGNTDYVYSPAQQTEIAAITDLLPARLTPENWESADLSGVEVIFSTWGMVNFTEAQLAKMPQLKAVFYAAGATDGFAMPLLKRGVKISSAWRANAIPVAEMVTAQIILSLKNYFAHTASLRGPADWHKISSPGCYGETVALIGSGAISTLVRRMLQPYNLNILVVESLPEKRTVSIAEAFRRAYVVSNHLFNHETNYKVLTREMFASMRPGATFINTGRGAQVDEEGLIAVLRERPDLTALLDVTDPEPPVAGSPLYTLPNVHLSAHIAGSLNDEVHRMADYAIADYKRFADGEPLEHEVTEEMLLAR